MTEVIRSFKPIHDPQSQLLFILAAATTIASIASTDAAAFTTAVAAAAADRTIFRDSNPTRSAHVVTDEAD